MLYHDDDLPTVPQPGRSPRLEDDPTVAFALAAPQTVALSGPTVPVPDQTLPVTEPAGPAFDRTVSLVDQDHSTSITVAAALPKRVPAARLNEPAPPASQPQPPITHRIGPGVEAVERARRVRSAADRIRARAWRIGNTVLTVAIVAAATWAGWQWWQRWHPQLGVEHVTVAVAPPTSPCDTEYDLVGTITTNGKAGTITYQWIRSDGAATKHLTVNVPARQRTTTVHLYWTFSGEGRQSATATLKVVDPTETQASGRFSYACVTR